MSNQLAERYRYLANESRRLATNDPYVESRNFHLRMAELYSMLVEATERTGNVNGCERSGITNSILRTPRTSRPKDPRDVAPHPSARHPGVIFHSFRSEQMSGFSMPRRPVRGGLDAHHVSLQIYERRRSTMCDYSLQNVASRPAVVGDKLVTRDFGMGTRGFAAPESPQTAVCLLPGTEIAFPNGLRITHRGFLGWSLRNVRYVTAIFRQINKQSPRTHHDAIEFPDGHTVLLTSLPKGQLATVLQLPARPSTTAEAEEQTRAAYVG
jgi:hypothetical protein